MPVTNDTLDQTIHQRHAAGASIRAIAGDLGVSRYRVERALMSYHAAATRALEPGDLGKLAGGRATVDDRKFTGLSGFSMILNGPADEPGGARIDWMSEDALRQMSVTTLLEIGVNSSPEMSRALWDFLRMAMPGHEIEVFQAGTRDPDDAGQAVIDAFRDALRWRHGAEEVPYGRLFINAVLRGGMCAEVVLDDQFVAQDLAVPDAATIKFRRRDDPVLGQTWEMGQYHGTTFVVLDQPTVRYIPVDPLPAKPHGRSPYVAALFPCLFMLGFYQDLKRVVANQGYPRPDVEIDIEKVLNYISLGDPNRLTESNAREVEDQINTLLQQTRQVAATLRPQDWYVHTNLVNFKTPQGTLSAGNLGMISTIIEHLERMAIRALKSMPLLFGVTDGVSEANANRQWEIHAAGIKSIQHLAENLLESLYEVLLQAAGYLCDVRVRFAELRSTEELRDQQSLAAKISNYTALMDRGFMTPNEAAQAVLGFVSDAVALAYDDPDGTAATDDAAVPAVADDDPEPGSNRALRKQTRPRRWNTHRDLDEADTEPIDDAEIAEALAWFDRQEPDYAGLLDADVLADEDRAVRAATDGSTWGWDPAKRRYVDTTTGKTVSTATTRAMRNRLAGSTGDDLDRLLTRYRDGEITATQFRLYGEAAIKRGTTANYLLGRGGRNAMTATEWGRTGALVKRQYDYWRGLVTEITGGEVTDAQARARLAMYGGSTTEAYERGTASAYGVHGKLPTYPGEQACLSNCRCYWAYTAKKDRVEVVWKRSGGADSCTDCTENEATYNPFVIELESAP